MNAKLFLISSIFLFSSFCFAGEIHDLAEKGDLQSIKDFIEKYENNPKKLERIIKSKDKYGNTAIDLAIYGRSTKIADLLLENLIEKTNAPEINRNSNSVGVGALCRSLWEKVHMPAHR